MKSFKWYINRLLSMSLLEIPYRIKQQMQMRFIDSVQLKGKGIIESFGDGTISEVFPFNASKYDSSYYSRSNIFKIFTKEVELDGEFLWRMDIENEVITPLVRSSKIQYAQSAIYGEPKYVKEINRFHHLWTIARNYSIKGESYYIELFSQQIRSWVDQNPFLLGINWRDGIECAIRATNWILAFQFFDKSSIEPELYKLFYKQLYLHGCFISSHLSLFSSANNHLLAELMGLITIGLATDYPQSKKWVKKAKKMLFREIKRQTFIDGFNKEQSTRYHAFSFDLVCISVLLLSNAGYNIPDGVWTYLRKMIEVVFILLNENGEMCEIGDSDDGYVIRCVQDPQFNIYQSILCTGAILFDEPKYLQKAKCFDERNYLLFGEPGKIKYHELSKKIIEYTQIENILFKDSGYYVINDNNMKLIFDCGPVGFLKMAAHGHADSLSFTLFINGIQYLTDPGTYTYHKSERYRNYFRGTSAHNTLRINKRDQSVIGGPFIWLSKADTRIEKVGQTDEAGLFIKATHNGYVKQGIRATHSRRLDFLRKKKLIRIIDEVNCKEPVFVEIYFHTSPKINVVRDDKALLLKIKSGRHIKLTSEDGLIGNVCTGEEMIPSGWFSPGYGQIIPTSTIVFSVKINQIGTTLFNFEIDFNKA